MKIQTQITIIADLVKKGFLATNQGFYAKIVKGEPIVIYYDWDKELFAIDRAEHSGTFTTIAELEVILNYSAKEARELELKKRFEQVLAN